MKIGLLYGAAREGCRGLGLGLGRLLLLLLSFYVVINRLCRGRRPI